MINNNFSTIKRPRIVLIALGFLFIFFFYGKIILHPNDYMFSTKGDGIKNYYTYADQITHGKDLMNFEGMNFPFGENILYTDCHPIFTVKLQALGQYFPFVKTHSIGILNFLLILGILLTLWVLYELLLELKFNRWLSLLFAFGITLLAPQIFRIGGHFALSYSVAIPLSWWLYLRSNRGLWKWFTLLFFNNLFWLFIHAYLGIIVLVFLLMMVVFASVIRKFRPAKPSILVKQFASILLPIFIFLAITKLSDTHHGRTDNPSGFLLYNAELDDVFLPHSPPLRPLLDQLTHGVIKLQWEAWGYVGIVNTLLLLALLLMLVISIKKIQTRNQLKKLFNNQPLVVGLMASVVVLIFALGIPFRQFPVLLDYFSVVKQFRATGRFVWPFYFAYTIFGAYVIQAIFNYFVDQKKKKTGIGLLILVLTINLVEGLPYHINTSNNISQNVNLFDQNQLDNSTKNALQAIHPQDYQAIISLPFFYQGSESFSRPRQDQAVTNSMVVSYHTGLPMVNANLTRTSVWESKNIVQLITPNYYPKAIKKDLPNKKPFLILYTKGKITPYEQLMLSKGTPIFENEKIELLSLNYDRLFEDESSNIHDHFEAILPQLTKKDGFYVTDSTAFIYYQDYENTLSDTTFRGKGSYRGIKKGKNTLAEFPPSTFEKDQEYHLSIWMYNGEKDALNLWFRLMVEEYDPIKDQWYTTTFFPEQAEVINEDWSLVEGSFKIRNPRNQIAIVTKGKENSKAKFHADDLLIRSKNVEIYRYEDQYTNRLFYNNHSIK